MPNFSVTETNLIDTVNYLLAGPQTVGQETKGFWSYGGGYLTGNNTPPFVQDTVPTYTQPSLGNILTLYTPAYVNVKTTSSTDRVIVTGQFRPFQEVTFTDPTTTWNIFINVNRYKLVNASTPFFIDYISYETIAQDNNFFNNTVPANFIDGSTSFGETVFASIVDNPPIGYYAYVLDVEYRPNLGDSTLVSMYGENIGITAAVIKI